MCNTYIYSKSNIINKTRKVLVKMDYTILLGVAVGMAITGAIGATVVVIYTKLFGGFKEEVQITEKVVMQPEIPQKMSIVQANGLIYIEAQMSNTAYTQKITDEQEDMILLNHLSHNLSDFKDMYNFDMKFSGQEFSVEITRKKDMG